MTYAIIKNGKVENIIEADQAFADSIGAILVSNGGIGWLWDGQTLTPPPISEQATEELQAEIRSRRNDLLSASDWTQVADSPVDKAVWATYRQALRDVTTQTGFPWNITWPDAP